MQILVVNAGQPLDGSLAAVVKEHKVPESYFWTASVSEGVKVARSLNADYCLLTNADTSFIPGSISRLIAWVEANPKTIACSPAYLSEDGHLKLLYSHQSDLGPLLYGKLVRRWNDTHDAPEEPFSVDLTGGQGVLIPMDLFDTANVDIERFPQYASDHDLWLQARRLGYPLILIPQAGVVNHRDFNVRKREKSLLAVLIKRMTTEYSPESWIIMWRLRRKHQGLLLGTLTTVIAFGLRWTIGFPKIVRRS